MRKVRCQYVVFTFVAVPSSSGCLLTHWGCPQGCAFLSELLSTNTSQQLREPVLPEHVGVCSVSFQVPHRTHQVSHCCTRSCVHGSWNVILPVFSFLSKPPENACSRSSFREQLVHLTTMLCFVYFYLFQSFRDQRAPVSLPYPNLLTAGLLQPPNFNLVASLTLTIIGLIISPSVPSNAF